MTDSMSNRIPGRRPPRRGVLRARLALLVLLLVGGLPLPGCETLVDYDWEASAPRLVVSSVFCPDSVWAVQLGRSLSIADPAEVGDLVPITEAVVVIREAGGGVVDTLRHRRAGRYEAASGQRPQPGRVYELAARAPGLPPVRATGQVPETPQLPSYELTFLGTSTWGDEQQGRYRLTFELEDPPGPDVYFLELVQRQPPDFGSVTTTPYDQPVRFESADPDLQAYFFDDAPVRSHTTYHDGALLEDAHFDGERRPVTLTLHASAEAAASPVVRLRVYALSEALRQFEQTASWQEEYERDPFTVPVRVRGNVEGGLGLFAGYSRAVLRVPLGE